MCKIHVRQCSCGGGGGGILHKRQLCRASWFPAELQLLSTETEAPQLPGPWQLPEKVKELMGLLVEAAPGQLGMVRVCCWECWNLGAAEEAMKAICQRGSSGEKELVAEIIKTVLFD